MAWFCNHYECARCDHAWSDQWSCMCDDDCPNCGARHMSPVESDDLTEIIEQHGDEFVVLRSPETAEDRPDYGELGRFSTRLEAQSFLNSPALDMSDPERPAWTEEDSARAKLLSDAFPLLTQDAEIDLTRKVTVSLRLSRDVVERYKAKGPGWQARIDEDLRRALGSRNSP